MDFTLDKENKTVSIKREFAADRNLVWEAWTNPEILDQWWAPKPIISRTESMDFKVGGRRFYAMVNPDGQEGWSVQKYTSISPKDNFRFLSSFTDKDENPSSQFSASEWDVNFSEHNGTTTVSITIKRDSLDELEKLIEMGFKDGFTKALENLDEYFASVKK